MSAAAASLTPSPAVRQDHWRVSFPAVSVWIGTIARPVRKGHDLVQVAGGLGGCPRWPGPHSDNPVRMDPAMTSGTTLNVANIESLGEVVSRITGVHRAEPVPDAFVRAGEITLVDLAPAALRRRLAQGLVVPAERCPRHDARQHRTAGLGRLFRFARRCGRGGLGTPSTRAAPARAREAPALVRRSGSRPAGPRVRDGGVLRVWRIVLGKSGAMPGVRLRRAEAARRCRGRFLAHV